MHENAFPTFTVLHEHEKYSDQQPFGLISEERYELNLFQSRLNMKLKLRK